MSNRVEELELKVSDLQAAVNGLTEELVETKERVRQLEQQVDVDDPSTSAADAERVVAGEADAEATTDDDVAESADATSDVDSAEDDVVFVDADERRAEREAERKAERDAEADEEAKSEESNGDEKDAESEQDDIIVA